MHLNVYFICNINASGICLSFGLIIIPAYNISEIGSDNRMILQANNPFFVINYAIYKLPLTFQ